MPIAPLLLWRRFGYFAPPWGRADSPQGHFNVGIFMDWGVSVNIFSLLEAMFPPIELQGCCS
jgi:hypothetical protein